MKNLLLLLMMFISLDAFAGDDDILVTRDGNLTPVKIVKISTQEVTYIDLSKKKRQRTAPTNSVYMIMKEKGSNIFFDEEGNQMTSPVVKIDKKDNVMFTNGGKIFPIYEVSIGKDAVTYKLQDKKKADVETMNKSDIFMIRNSDGTTTVFTMPKETSQPNNTQTNTNSSTQNILPETQKAKASSLSPVEQRNLNLINAYNNISVGWTEIPKDKKSHCSYCRLKLTEESVMENDEVSMAFGTQTITKSGWEEAIQYSPVVNPAFCVTIKNKTNKTIYIDLGNTFFSRGGEAQPYYIPGETHQYKGGTTGASVNMGAVAGALGVGGALGTLANGVNVGSTSQSGTTKVTYEQRVIAIPPMSTKSLSPKLFFIAGNNQWYPILEQVNRSTSSKLLVFANTRIDDWMRGDMLHWEAYNSPLNFSFFVTYALDESCTNTVSMKSDLYLSDMYGVDGVGQAEGLANLKEFSREWKQTLHFFIYNFKGNGQREKMGGMYSSAIK